MCPPSCDLVGGVITMRAQHTLQTFCSMGKTVRRWIAPALLVLFVLGWAAPAHAQFSLGTAANYVVLYEGGGGNTLNVNNFASVWSGNIGVGGTGKFAATGPGSFNGTIQFSAAASGQYSCSNTTINGTFCPTGAPSVLYSQSNVSSALSTVNSLSSTLGAQTGTTIASINIANGANYTLNASSGTLIGGNRVFTVTSFKTVNGSTLTINGSASDYVVVNFHSSVQFNGAIVLTGGITSDHVLFNETGGGTLAINTNGAAVTGTFLNPNGGMSAVHSVINGRFFGGDSTNMQIVSGVALTQPTTPTPEPETITLFGSGLLVLGAALRWRLRSPRSNHSS